MKQDVVIRSTTGKALERFDPRKTRIRVAGLKAAIAQAAKLQDREIFRAAVETYVSEVAAFCAWWNENVTGERDAKLELSSKRGGKVVAKTATTIPVGDAEAQTGISKYQVSRWRDKLTDREAYTNELCGRMWRYAWERKDRQQMHAEDEERVRSLARREGKFRTLVIDPPWDYDWLSIAGRAKPGYATMTHGELLNLDVRGWAEDECHLYLWTTNNFIARACTLVEAWGFQHRTVLTWVKPRWGLGSYFRNQTEHVLFATLGDLRTRRDDVSTIVGGTVRKHSEKPDEFYDLVLKQSHAPYGEAFQRTPREEFIDLFVGGLNDGVQRFAEDGRKGRASTASVA